MSVYLIIWLVFLFFFRAFKLCSISIVCLKATGHIMLNCVIYMGYGPQLIEILYNVFQDNTVIQNRRGYLCVMSTAIGQDLNRNGTDFQFFMYQKAVLEINFLLNFNVYSVGVEF